MLAGLVSSNSLAISWSSSLVASVFSSPKWVELSCSDVAALFSSRLELPLFSSTFWLSELLWLSLLFSEFWVVSLEPSWWFKSFLLSELLWLSLFKSTSELFTGLLSFLLSLLKLLLLGACALESLLLLLIPEKR